MRRVFVGDGEVSGDRLILTDGRAHHLRTVLRMVAGDTFTAVTPGGGQRLATIEEVGPHELVASLGAPEPSGAEPSLPVHLYQAVLKSDAMSLVVRQAVELGVAAITPMLTRRSVVRLDDDAREPKQRRWQQIAEGAARQSERGAVPEVHLPCDFGPALASRKPGPGLILAERGAEGACLSVAEALGQRAELASCALFVGPEGGFTDDELRLALERGLVPVTLGPRILRAETAAIVACALVMSELGQLE